MLFKKIDAAPADPVLALNKKFRADTRTEKMNLGIGVFRDERGTTPIFKAVKEAELRVQASQDTKEYLGIAGNRGFLEAVGRLIFPQETLDDGYRAFQSVGGTGGVRIILDSLATAAQGATVWLPALTWGNHRAIAASCGFSFKAYDWSAFDMIGDAENAIESMSEAKSGDIIVLHANCHNPTGIDMSSDALEKFSAFLAERDIFPVIDAAYLGFGAGLDADLVRLQKLANGFSELAIVFSCSKNFGLYRDRVGALFIKGDDHDALAKTYSNMEAAIRANYSMPADHGAVVVSTILNDPELSASWRSELEAQRLYVVGSRQMLADNLAATIPAQDWSYIREGFGMFSMLPFKAERLQALATEKAIYIMSSGRINVAGLQRDKIPGVAKVLADYF